MQFLEAIQTCVVKKYCDFNGRASRSEFWWYTLGNMIVCYAWSFIVSMITGASVMVGADGQFHFSALQLLSYIPSIALLLPTLGVGARRLHDIGKSGWSLLIAIIPIIGSIILLIWEVKDSDQNANQYGESPKYEEVNV